MENTIITKEAYEKLTTTSINFEKMVKEAGFSKEEVEKLSFQGQIKEKEADTLHGSSFAHFSSFLYYNKDEDTIIEPKPMDIIKSRENVFEVTGIQKDWNNIDVLQNWDKVSDPLKAGFVFIGTNASTGANGVNFERFENFHNIPNGKNPSSIKKYYDCFKSDIEHYIKNDKDNEKLSYDKDYTLSKNGKRFEKIKSSRKRESDIQFFLDNIHGSYITDLVKGLPTADSAELDKEIKKMAKSLNNDKKYIEEFRAKFANLFTNMLVRELGLLGNVTHTLIIMNAKSNKFIQEMLDIGQFEEKYKTKDGKPLRIHRVNHYSASTPYFERQEQLESVFDRN